MTRIIPADYHNARILVTNDDGVHASGIASLAALMREMSDDVWVVAPTTQQSGAGHSLTLHHPLRAHKLEERIYGVDGTPTDCVLLAAKAVIPQDKPIDLVVSGINYGDNMAEHVTYSGTIAAAMEGTMMGIASIAFSQEIRNGSQPISSEVEAMAIRQVMRACSGMTLHDNALLSVNIPHCSMQDLQPLQASRQGSRSAIESLHERFDPRGDAYYWIGSMDYSACEHKGDTDCAQIAANHPTITPLTLDLTDHDALQALTQRCKSSGDVAA